MNHPTDPNSERKGRRTATRIMDAAEPLFASRGYKGTSLRDIAKLAYLQQPGIYKHFKNKQDLYTAVLDRALSPMIEAMQEHLAAERDYGELWERMTDILAAHPGMASLFQQALRDHEDNDLQPVNEWLTRLFSQGKNTLDSLSKANREEQAIKLIASFNLVTGYFLSQKIFAQVAEGKVTDANNVKKQKQLLRAIAESWI